jgi:hypothetical protein
MRYALLFLVLMACKPYQATVYPIATTPPLVSPPKTEEEVARYDDNWDDLTSKETGVISTSETFRIGDRLVGLSIYKRQGNITLVNVHDNENTSVQAAKIVIDSLGGKLFQLRHTGERNIQFRLNGKQYEFDPNRIFTEAGARETLTNLGAYSDEAHHLVRRFANSLVDSLDVEVILTLHNNTEGNYSAASYLDEYRSDAADVFLNPARDPDDFFFVTERLFFEELRARGFNVVLQNNATVTDDGSLSVLAGQRGIPYINIETEHGHLQEQVEMLFVMYDMFQ